MEIDLTTQVAEAANIDRNLVSRVIPMFENGYTVPFIARYRKEITGGAEPTVLHRLKEKMNDCKMLVDKIEKSLQFFDKSGLLTNELSQQLMKCKTTEDIKLLGNPFKSKGPRTLAGRAKAVNLEPIALDILHSNRCVDMYSLAPPEAKKTFTSKTALEDAVSHIIADIFAKDLDIIRKAEELCSKYIATLVTAKKSKRGKKVEQSSGGNLPNSMSIDFDENENADDAECIQNSHSSMNNTNNNSKKDDLVTFKNYLNFSRPVSSILAHQVLAINRANERGVITVKIHLSPQVQHNCATFVSQKYFPTTNRIHWDFVMSAFNDAWKRLIDPHLVRSIRTKLTTSAQDASLEVFSENLRRLLMTAPLRDRLPVIGLDPGWRNGCKWAACDPHGNVLSTGILWPPHTLSAIPPKKLSVQNGPMSNNALGNGQGSRQTGSWLAYLIQIQHFKPLNVRYAVVSECGASYYSASKVACTELPDLDVSFRGAVSIARRLQDPLAELVKLEPKHLGVGMYQHDIPVNQLTSAVHNVMEECISFVGVDLNAAPLHILSRVAGLSEMKAKAILTYRSQVGPFRSRADLLKVKGIGQATFAQCAGFVRVKPTYSTTTLDGTKDVEMISISSGDDNDGDDLTCDTQITNIFTGSTKRKHISNESNKKCKKGRIMDVAVTDQSDVNCFNPLDQTAVHPDSYEVAANIISLLQLNLTDVGSMKMRTAATQFMISEDRDKRLEQFCSKTVGLDTLRDILVALTRPLDFDERQDCFTPLFHSTVMKISDLRKGMQVKGRVENVTTFGAFCDIGVEENAYIPRHEYPRNCSTSNLKIASETSTTGIGVSDGGDIHHKMFTLRLGDRIKATVSGVDIKYKRVALHKVFVMT
ncbi:tex protein-relatedtranscription accessory protein (S1 rna binding domain) [Schistosoma mansoni]|uniref:tex protein-relatedtranscription accessory protein (S1 rna binding domain) n=1 Tax=Schistosoma mansoni TaxID=6183 RepID=UPI0001A63AEC|nr:tex protein-relatedtranscription accessory protein (S1 rna binding domain) [Schistosoma mansoni]|eukprot:XP_018652644.1 tex protein-relatedtranscription accessory protein (S1 rna binding domain) [Schistosoma mansoni]